MLKKLAKFFPIIFFATSLELLFLSSPSIIRSQTCDDPNQTYFNGGTCPDGWSYGPGCSYHSSWQERHEEACENHQDDDDNGGGGECDGAANTCCNGDRYMGDGSVGPQPWCGTTGSETVDGPCTCEDDRVSCSPCGDGTACQMVPNAECVETGNLCTVDGSCSKNSCSNTCTINGEPINCHDERCGIWTSHYACIGQTNEGCGKGSHSEELSGKSSIQYSEDYWCSTQQMDSNSGGGEFTVVEIGDGGAWCAEWFDGQSGAVQTDCGSGASSQSDLDWDCSDEPTDTPTPNPPTNTPAPPGPPAPQCTSLNITAEPGGPIITDYSALQLDQEITLKCGATAEGDQDIFYQFRVFNPNKFRILTPNYNPEDIDPSFISGILENTYINYTIPEYGRFVAQCRVCTHAAESTCQGWGPLPGSNQVIPESDESLPQSDESIPESGDQEVQPEPEEIEERQQVAPEAGPRNPIN